MLDDNATATSIRYNIFGSNNKLKISSYLVVVIISRMDYNLIFAFHT